MRIYKKICIALAVMGVAHGAVTWEAGFFGRIAYNLSSAATGIRDLLGYGSEDKTQVPYITGTPSHPQKANYRKLVLDAGFINPGAPKADDKADDIQCFQSKEVDNQVWITFGKDVKIMLTDEEVIQLVNILIMSVRGDAEKVTDSIYQTYAPLVKRVGDQVYIIDLENDGDKYYFVVGSTELVDNTVSLTTEDKQDKNKADFLLRNADLFKSAYRRTGQKDQKKFYKQNGLYKLRYSDLHNTEYPTVVLGEEFVDPETQNLDMSRQKGILGVFNLIEFYYGTHSFDPIKTYSQVEVSKSDLTISRRHTFLFNGKNVFVLSATLMRKPVHGSTTSGGGTGGSDALNAGLNSTGALNLL